MFTNTMQCTVQCTIMDNVDRRVINFFYDSMKVASLIGKMMYIQNSFIVLRHDHLKKICIRYNMKV